MKKLYLIHILMFSIFFNCSEQDYVAPYGDFSSFTLFTSKAFDDNATSVNANINSYIGFNDLSKNAISHTWVLPSGTALLENTFTEADSVYTDFVRALGPTASSEDLINVLFNDSGTKEILLTNVFNDSVAESIPQNDGTWLLEKTFTVNVFDDIKPAFQVLKGTEVLLNITESDLPDIENESSWANITIEAGEELTFLDLTTVGEPNNRTWTFESGNIETSQEKSITVLYNSLGEFSIGSLTSIRGNTPLAITEATKVIPATVTVVPSTQPFVINGSITEDETEVLSFNVTGEVTSVGALEENNFIVTVSNTAANFNQIISVQSVSINSLDATQIDLTLLEPIYNTDVVEISYTSGNIQSVDFRTLASFDTQIVEMNFQGAMNIPGYTGYETEWSGSGNQFKKANTEGYFAQHNGNSDVGPLYYYRDESKAYEGNSSMKFETSAAGIPSLARLQGAGFTTLSPVTSGTYIPSVWVFIDPETTMTNFQYNFTTSSIGTFNFDISTTEKGKWIRLTLPEVILPTLNAGRFDINVTEENQNDEIVQKLWLDNFDLLIIEDRL